MANADDMNAILQRVDGRGYKAYRDLRGAFEMRDFTLHVDHVQADPFASPSKLRARFALSVAELPADLFEGRVRRVALEDFLAREIAAALRARAPAQRGTGKSGVVRIDAGGQAVLERSAVRIGGDFVEARLEVGLPAFGRRIAGQAAAELLLNRLPPALRRGLCWSELPVDSARRFVECVENQEDLRERLDDLGLVAFVADGSILARRSGADDRPMPADRAVPFRAPDGFARTLELPNAIDTPDGPTRTLRGMGIPKGVSLIVGGGYHGKSTLLQALERGVHPHVPGDGREGVVCSRNAVKVRAEDGRFVGDVNLEPFIRELPGGRDTRRFRSDDASGSTSQASQILEAVEVGATALLIDEDTSATNFMVRDARMRRLIPERDEPITPFIDRVQALHRQRGVSTVLVMGGVGDYFAVADHVIAMREYLPVDVTDQAHRIAAEGEPASGAAVRTGDSDMPASTPRVPLAASFDASRGRRTVHISTRGRELLQYGEETVDLRCVAPLEDASQTLAIGHAVHLASERFVDGERSLADVLDALEQRLDTEGVDALRVARRGEEHPGNFARPRRFEIAAAVNRLRSLRMR